MQLGFIGCGNMASAMIKGILAKGIFTAENIIASNSTAGSARRTEEELGISAVTDNVIVAEKASVIFLGVKPDLYQTVIEEIKDTVGPEKIVVSITPAKNFAWMEAQFGKKVKLVRTIPNTPCQTGEGMTGVCYNEWISETEIGRVEEILNSFGMVEVLPEHLMEVVGSVAGSSPAFIYMIIEAMADAAVEAGMPRAQAYRVAAQAVTGSGRMVLESEKHPGQLKDEVCSPGGSTIAGVRVLEAQGVRSAMIEAVKATVERAKRL